MSDNRSSGLGRSLIMFEIKTIALFVVTALAEMGVLFTLIGVGIILFAPRHA